MNGHGVVPAGSAADGPRRPRNRRRSVLPVFVLILVALDGRSAAPARAAENVDPRIVVGVYEDPPFTYHDKDGNWTGLAVDLWREIARREGLDYDLRESTLEALDDGLEAGTIDVGVGSIFITADRQRKMDFTSPFLHVAMGIASRPASTGGWLRATLSVFSGPIFTATVGLAAMMLGFGLLVWFLERRKNPEHFGGNAASGIAEGLWWSATTMTTVGYGDRTPITFWGRVVGIVWMFISIVLVSSFIAVVTSALTVHRLDPVVRSFADLPGVRVGVIGDSAAAAMVADLGIAPHVYASPEAGLRDLVAERIDAFLDEQPVLGFLSRHQFASQIAVVPQSKHQGFVAFALPMRSPILHRINVALLEALATPWWQERRLHYLNS